MCAGKVGTYNSNPEFLPRPVLAFASPLTALRPLNNSSICPGPMWPWVWSLHKDALYSTTDPIEPSQHTLAIHPTYQLHLLVLTKHAVDSQGTRDDQPSLMHLYTHELRRHWPAWSAAAEASGRLCRRLMFLDRPPPAETEASIRRGSQAAGPTVLYSKVLRGPLPRTACRSASEEEEVRPGTTFTVCSDGLLSCAAKVTSL